MFITKVITSLKMNYRQKISYVKRLTTTFEIALSSQTKSSKTPLPKRLRMGILFSLSLGKCPYFISKFTII